MQIREFARFAHNNAPSRSKLSEIFWGAFSSLADASQSTLSIYAVVSAPAVRRLGAQVVHFWSWSGRVLALRPVRLQGSLHESLFTHLLVSARDIPVFDITARTNAHRPNYN